MNEFYGECYCNVGAMDKYKQEEIKRLKEEVKKKNREIGGLKRRNTNLQKKINKN